MSPQLQQLLALAIPVVVGIVTVPLFNLIERLSLAVESLPDPVKRLVVLVVAALINWLCQLVGVMPPTSVGGLDSTAVGTILSAVLAYLLHLANQVGTVKSAQASIAAHVGAVPPLKGG